MRGFGRRKGNKETIHLCYDIKIEKLLKNMKKGHMLFIEYTDLSCHLVASIAFSGFSTLNLLSPLLSMLYSLE